MLDLSKGLYDAGVHMKFRFPMVFTATFLSWAVLEYGDQMAVVNQLEPAQENLKCITDYLLNAHPSDNMLYIQVLVSWVNLFAGKGLPSSVNSGLQMYRETAQATLCGLIPKSLTATSSRTDNGFIWVSEWNALRHPVAAAFFAVVYCDYMLSSQTATISYSGKSYKAKDLRKFAISQADYVLGKNPTKMSFLVGYEDKYPQFVHHSRASIPIGAKTGCDDGFKWLDCPDPNPNVAVGELVGGLFLNKTFIDSRNNTMQVEPAHTTVPGLLASCQVWLPLLMWFNHLHESLTSFM